MNARPANRLPRGQWVVFGVLLLLSVGMMGASGSRLASTIRADVNYLLNPVETVINDAADTVGSYWTTLTQLDRLRSENDQLRQENTTLREQLMRMPAIARLNDDWTRISLERDRVPYETTVAGVVLRDISDVRPKTLVINRGLADGIVKGQVVIDDGGALVGRISKVEQYDSTVLLVTDTSAVVIGSEATSGAIGTVSGIVGGQLQMTYVNSTDKLSVGQAVVTAGLVLPGGNVTSPYPKGLLIGQIVSVVRDPNQVVQSALIQPAANLNDAEFVLVLTNFQGGFASPGPSTNAVPTASGSLPPQTPAPTPTPPPTPSPTPAITPRPTLVPIPSY
jgi:rod shape-determining protein MreC